MSTTSRRIAAQKHDKRPSRTKSSKARLYIAKPLADGWPAFTGTDENWRMLGLRRRATR